MDFDDIREWVEDHHKLLSYIVILPAFWLASAIVGVPVASIPKNIFFGSMEHYQAICFGFWLTAAGVMINSQKKTTVSKYNCPRCGYAWDEVSESQKNWEA